jgi:hypothetical protein
MLEVRRMASGLCAFIGVWCCGWAAGQPNRSELMEEHSRARKMAMAFHVYAQEHDDTVAPDFAALLPYLAGDLSNATPVQRSQALREAFMSGRDQGVKVPDNADQAWLSANSSFGYIAGGGLKLSDLGDWGNLAILHLKLDKGIPAERSEMNPEGLVFPVVFVDSHSETLTRAEAERVISESTAMFEALKTGGPLPDSQQAQMDVRAIARAIGAYAKANKGDLPPDLGSTLAFIPADSKRTATAKQRAGLYLSPAARKTTHIPDEPTPEWINERTSYIYLGGAGIQLGAIEDPGNTIIVHGKLDSPVEFKTRAGLMPGVAVGTVRGAGGVEEEEYARWIVDVSRRVVLSAKTGAPLPDHINAYRDARIIGQGIASYAKEHKGLLPPDLGAALPYILPDSPVKDRVAVFLSPLRERNTVFPDAVTSEWVVRHSSYTYLGGAGIDLKLAREAGVQIFFHGPLAEAYEVRVPYASISVVAAGTAYHYPWLTPVDQTETQIKTSKELLDALHAAAK